MNPLLVEGLKGHGGLGHFLRPTDWKYNSFIGGGTPPFNWNIGYDVEEELSAVLGIPNFKIPLKDQGRSFSCGGQATSYYDSVLNAFKTKKYTERSAKFVYAQAFEPGGGSFGGNLMNVAKKQGVSAEYILPSYEGGRSPSEQFMERIQDITPESRNDAAVSKTSSYSYTIDFDIDLLAQMIRDNKGIVVAIYGQNNGTWLSAFPTHPTAPIGSSLLWGHWLYAGKVKIIAGVKYIGVANSWGAEIGDAGWQWISEEYVNSGYLELGMVMGMSIESYQFKNDIFMGMTSPDVYFLQKSLNKNPATQIAATGPGSPGNETYYFGQLTKQAVIKYQILNNIRPSVGYVGEVTRASLNKGG